ncbi:MAG: RNA polymerase sigma factor [Chitinophagaceae bacterium]|nr:RNA polymerase sigma factor [Chitinophagaceae bacterium]
MENISAETLVQQCLTGNTGAYKELYLRYAKAMFNTALRIVKNEADAEDVVQESFTDAFAQLKNFQQKSTFGAWLKQIVVYKSIHSINKTNFLVDDIDSINDIIDDDKNDVQNIELTVQKVRDAIQQLPAGYRTVLSLYLLEGYDHEEIAEVLQVARVTVRTQYARAKNKLLEILKPANIYE